MTRLSAATATALRGSAKARFSPSCQSGVPLKSLRRWAPILRVGRSATSGLTKTTMQKNIDSSETWGLWNRASSDPKWLHSFFAVEDPDEWVKPVPDLSEP